MAVTEAPVVDHEGTSAAVQIEQLHLSSHCEVACTQAAGPRARRPHGCEVGVWRVPPSARVALGIAATAFAVYTAAVHSLLLRHWLDWKVERRLGSAE